MGETALIRLTPAQKRILRELVEAGERVYGGRSGIALWTLKLLGLATVRVRYIHGGEQVSEEWTACPTEAGRALLSGQPALAASTPTQEGR